ncbi:glycosyltransferase [Catenulispora pinisilvae]|uniref:glycosyltransferase n=1 Tax=Catenulispora pinisilvae TaxID=2705253 RepID=UPI00189253F7|nr:glycosyltransferase [Catenulispora pinisilvae]
MLVLWSVLGTADLTAAVVYILDGVFLCFFLRHTAFAVSALRHADPDSIAAAKADSLTIAGLTGYRPAVSVLVSCKNEQFVVDRLATGLLALDYPAELLQIVIVDDGSDDGTGEILDRRAAAEPRLLALHRPAGSGPAGKSAALNYALPRLTGEIVVVFDADHRPHADSLALLVRHFEDPSVGAVQGRCRIRNAADAPLTRLITVDYLAGYLVNEFGRQSVFGLPAYGGANCAIRLSALRDLGGWNVHSVTEDTDVTLRLLLAGLHVRYEPGAVDDEEGVTTVQRFWKQRYRWARGHQQVCRDYLRHVWRASHLSVLERIETVMFLLIYHVPVASLLALGLLVLSAAGLVPAASVPGGFVLWTLLFLGPLLEIGGGMLLARTRRADVLALVWFLPMFLVSAVLCAKAWFDGMSGSAYTWVRTDRSAAPSGPGPGPGPGPGSGPGPGPGRQVTS